MNTNLDHCFKMNFTIELQCTLDCTCKTSNWQGSYKIKYDNKSKPEVDILKSYAILPMIKALTDKITKINKINYYYTITEKPCYINIIIYKDTKEVTRLKHTLMVDISSSFNEKLIIEGDILNLSSVNDHYELFHKIEILAEKYALDKYGSGASAKVDKDISIGVKLVKIDTF